MNLIRRLSNDKIIDLTGGFTGVATTPPNPNPPADYRNKTLQSTPRKASKPPIKPSVTPLPLYSYTRPPSFSNKGLKAPGIAYTRSLEEADDLISLLRGPVGFDMEWKVDFRKNARQRPTALVQLCDDKLIVILHLYHMPKLPQELIKLLTNKDIIKFGVNIGNDGRKFFNDYKVQCKGLLELTFLAKSIHAEDLGTNKVLISLDKLTEYVLKQRLDKGNERVGDWESFLDWKQIEYAANDVYAGYQMYKRLSEQSKDTDYSNFLVEKDYETGLIKETPNNAANNTKPIPTTSDTHIRNSISNKVKYNTANRSIEREGTRITSLQPRHLKAIKAYFHDELSLDDTRKSLRPEKPLAQITVAIYVTEALLLTKEGYSDAMLNRLNSDLRYLNENVRKAWYEDVGSLID